jgi:hypothetical protein
MERHNKLSNRYTNILRRAEVFDFMFGTFHFEKDEIDMDIANYNDIAMELKLFGQRVCLEVDFLAREKKIPWRGGATFNFKKIPKVENMEMVNTICGKRVYIPRNVLRMLDVPRGLCMSLIQIFLRTIMNHHKTDIFGDYMRLFIYWVEDMVVDVHHLLAKKLHHALEESKKKKIKFSFSGTL